MADKLKVLKAVLKKQWTGLTPNVYYFFFFIVGFFTFVFALVSWLLGLC